MTAVNARSPNIIFQLIRWKQHRWLGVCLIESPVPLIYAPLPCRSFDLGDSRVSDLPSPDLMMSTQPMGKLPLQFQIVYLFFFHFRRQLVEIRQPPFLWTFMLSPSSTTLLSTVWFVGDTELKDQRNYTVKRGKRNEGIHIHNRTHRQCHSFFLSGHLCDLIADKTFLETRAENLINSKRVRLREKTFSYPPKTQCSPLAWSLRTKTAMRISRFRTCKRKPEPEK